MTLILNSSSDSNSTVLANVSCRSFAEDTSVRAVKILVYIIVLIVSLIGNCVIITTVERNKQMQTSINSLVANMAASDLLISIFAVPIKHCEILVGPRRWLLDGIVGLVSCKFSYFLQDISTAVSIQSLVVIAFDRYRRTVFHIRPAIITPKSCKIISSHSCGFHRWDSTLFTTLFTTLFDYSLKTAQSTASLTGHQLSILKKHRNDMV